MASGRSAPLFDLAEAAFDDVAAGVVTGKEADRAASGGALTAPAGLLVARFRNGSGTVWVSCTSRPNG
jgi:hypothetical protein